MSRTANRLLTTGLCISALCLSACGFQPMYAGSAYSELPGLEISRGSNRIDYLIEDSLRDFLGSGRSQYRLELTNVVEQRSLSLSGTGIARQTAVEVETLYVLFDDNSNIIASGMVTEQSFFDTGNDPYTIVSGQSAAEAQAAESIAERLVLELSIAIRRHQAGEAS